jgi:glycerophosphoryl diester phosphodiesterase
MVNSGIGELVWPIVVAHRGASSTFPENTLSAFAGAVDAGADMIELDVRCTLDNGLVVRHDSHVPLAAGGSANVHELTLDDLRRNDADAGHDERARIPTLAEVLPELSGRIGLDIEIKNLPGDPGYDGDREQAVEQVVRLLDDLRFDGPVLITSFNPDSIRRARELAPHLATGFLRPKDAGLSSALRAATEHGHRFVLPQADAVEAGGEAFTRECHDAGVLVGTWTVDDPDRIGRLFSMGVDAVATNDPAAALPARDAARAGVQP